MPNVIKIMYNPTCDKYITCIYNNADLRHTGCMCSIVAEWNITNSSNFLSYG